MAATSHLKRAGRISAGAHGILPALSSMCCILPGVGMFMENLRENGLRTSEYDLDERLGTVAQMLNSFDGSPVSRSLIRRAVLRSILHLPPNHEASEALDLFYEVLDQATNVETGRKVRNKSLGTASLNKIWTQAGRAIQTATTRMLKASKAANR